MASSYALPFLENREAFWGGSTVLSLNIRLTARAVRDTRTLRENMEPPKRDEKQNITISLDRQTIRKAKVLAARRSTSISGLLAHQIDVMVGEEESYQRAERQAASLLDQGFHLGTAIRASRDELHER